LEVRTTPQGSLAAPVGARVATKQYTVRKSVRRSDSEINNSLENLVMNFIFSRPLRYTGQCCAAILLAFLTSPRSIFAAEGGPSTNGPPQTATADSKTKPEGEFADTEYRNWITTTVGGYIVGGDKGQFQRRAHNKAGAFGGVEDFHWEEDVGKKGLFQVDGRGIFDNHDYSLKLDLTNPDIGYVRAGFSQFRTYYDGSGAWFPQNGAWFSPYDDRLAMDRGEIFFEAGLTLPDRPEFHFKYAHQSRDGQKDSLAWGDTNLTGGFGTKSIVPSFWDIDEKRDIFSFDIKHTLGNTDFGVGLRYELDDNNDSRNILRRPDEPTAQRKVTDREEVDTDMFNVHAFTSTQFNEQILFTTGYSYTRLDTDISGSRIYGADFDALYDPIFARDEGFLNLSGGSRVNQYVLNLNFMLTPWDDVAIVPSVRVEKQEQTGLADFIETSVDTSAKLNPTSDELFNTRDRGFVDVSEALEARYTGFKNWSLYARGEWLEGEGNLKEREMEAETGVVNLFRDTDSTRLTQKYAVGANWYPLKQLNFGGQYYHKIRQNDYDHNADSTTNAPPSTDRYPAFFREQDFDTDDINFRVTYRPLRNLTFISRYDFQLSTIDTRPDFLSKIQASEMTSHIFSESVTWAPLSRVYFQATLNYALDHTDSPVADAIPGTNLVLNAKNNYWNASFMTGFVLSEKSDLQTQYFYYRADNFVDNSQFGMPYGAGEQEQGVMATLNRRITPRLLWSLRYGFLKAWDATSGGHNNFTAHLASTSLTYRF
jgi:hypothetical protein